MKTVSASEICEILEGVRDPELPVLNVWELGLITEVKPEAGSILVRMIPTYSACPAVRIIRQQIREALEGSLGLPARVEIDQEIHWSSDRITEEGREKLRLFGISPPGAIHPFRVEELLSGVECPYCHGRQTYLKSPFGSTLCRAIHYCRDCHQSFEQFKPLE